MATTVNRDSTPNRDITTNMAALASWKLKDVVDSDVPVLVEVTRRIAAQGRAAERAVSRFASFI